LFFERWESAGLFCLFYVRWVGKIKQAKKALQRVGKKQVLGALGKNH
jgi:hypothetical protein